MGEAALPRRWWEIMGKKHKDGKKEKSGKKKSHAPADAAGIATTLAQAARSMRTVLSRNLLSGGLYAGQDGVILALAETGGMTAGALAAMTALAALRAGRMVAHRSRLKKFGALQAFAVACVYDLARALALVYCAPHPRERGAGAA